MNKRRLLGLLCLMALLVTSCDNKGDYWGSHGNFQDNIDAGAHL
ncbi:hypothetical protein NXX02_17295 [Bacteroides fragilis]|nr:hypothetical protein [Bacteroides fragilis]